MVCAAHAVSHGFASATAFHSCTVPFAYVVSGTFSTCSLLHHTLPQPVSAPAKCR